MTGLGTLTNAGGQASRRGLTGRGRRWPGGGLASEGRRRPGTMTGPSRRRPVRYPPQAGDPMRRSYRR
jgi:hypothetical protein